MSRTVGLDDEGNDGGGDDDGGDLDGGDDDDDEDYGEEFEATGGNVAAYAFVTNGVNA